MSLLLRLRLAATGGFMFAAIVPAQDPGRSRALETAVQDLEAQKPPPADAVPGFRMMDISLDLLTAVGTSTVRDQALGELRAGGHEPNRRGFSVQQAELALSGAVDPYFKAQANLVGFLDAEGETVLELEEAFLATQQLPFGLQAKVGTFFVEFGRHNAKHPHAWDWQHQPVIATRLLGPDGARGPAARMSWLAPTATPIEVLVGAHQASGETMTSFLANDEVYEERPIGGRAFVERDVTSLSDLAWSTRVQGQVDLAADHTLGLGASLLLGPNATGADADTIVYGTDFAYRWRPVDHDKGWPFVKVQGEFMARSFDAEDQVDDSDPLNPVAVPSDTLEDFGGYGQVLYGFARGYSGGVRVDWASAAGASYDRGSQGFDRSSDPFRTDRLRVSPLFTWHASEFARIRLQYDYDDSDHLRSPAHSVFLSFEALLGTHPAHGM